MGGRLLAAPFAGSRDDTRLAARSDVLTFAGPALTGSLELIGTPVVELQHSSDNPNCDLFVRLCEVNARGRSRNVSDGFLRLGLMVAGGSFPHWDRNLGTGEDPATGTRLSPATHTLDLAGSRVWRPVSS